MPNHNSNTLTVDGPGAEEFMRQAVAVPSDGEFMDGSIGDFIAHFIPRPAELTEFVSGKDINGEHIYVREDKDGNQTPVSHEEIAAIEKEHGTIDWLEWSRKHWGTKWGAYWVEQIADDRLSFDTAWAPPIPAIETISKMFPNAVFTLAYAEGGMGFFGYMVISNGVVVDEFESDQYWNGKDMTDEDDPEDALTQACLDHQLKYGLRS